MVLTNVFIEKIMTNDLLMATILDMSTPATVIRFSQTCREAQLVFKSYMSRAFRLERNLSRFFSDPLEFRRLQARTATLISGSTALQFFDRSFWPESDLDVYVHMQFTKEVGKYLLQEGYTFIPGRIQAEDFEVASEASVIKENPDFYSFRGVASVFTFQKETADDMLKVQLIVARRSGVEVILHFHSSMLCFPIVRDWAFILFYSMRHERHILRKSLLSLSQSNIRGATLFDMRN